MERFALGTVQFGLHYGVSNQSGQVTNKEVDKILKTAYSAGINTLDTAVSYGSSEQVLGEAGINNWQVITKLPRFPEKCNNIEDWVNSTVSDALDRLKIKKLSGLLLHQPLQLLEENGTDLYQILNNLKKKELVNKIGYSIYSPNDLDKLYSSFKPDIIQAPFNIFDQQLLTSGWLKKLHKEGVEINVRSVFLQGLLLMKLKDLPIKFHRWKTLMDNWHKWLLKNNITPLQACLGFVLAQPEINRLVIGVDNARQLKEVLLATQTKVPSPPLEFATEDENLINPLKWANL